VSQSGGGFDDCFGCGGRTYLVGGEACVVCHDGVQHGAEVRGPAHKGAAVEVGRQGRVRAVGQGVEPAHALVRPAGPLRAEDHWAAEGGAVDRRREVCVSEVRGREGGRGGRTAAGAWVEGGGWMEGWDEWRGRMGKEVGWIK
jgi:hypothetical protein